jgi:hypothetical protein
LATSGDLDLAISGDFYMATDTGNRVGCAGSGPVVGQCAAVLTCGHAPG